jgi:hypothetical protein
MSTITSTLWVIVQYEVLLLCKNTKKLKTIILSHIANAILTNKPLFFLKKNIYNNRFEMSHQQSR